MIRLFPRCYRLLLFIGHTPEKASLILIDARRGDGFALLYLRTASQLRRGQPRLRALIEAFGEVEA